jgi:hypothetical protein
VIDPVATYEIKNLVSTDSRLQYPI